MMNKDYAAAIAQDYLCKQFHPESTHLIVTLIHYITCLSRANCLRLASRYFPSMDEFALKQ